MYTLSTLGAATATVQKLARETWFGNFRAEGASHSIDPDAPLETRIRQATESGLEIGTVLSRFSSKMQQSTDAQVRECVLFAARKKIYVPPEFICVDEGVSGRKTKRAGLDRVQAILAAGFAKTLLVYKVSRLFRNAYEGYQFFQEVIVEEDLRAIAVSQDIDTADEKRWKMQVQIHGIMDEALIETIGDHVRSGAKQSFLQGFPIGAFPIGYSRVPDPNVRSANGKPRHRPVVDPQVAALIRQHFEWIRDGMSLREGFRRWREANGPVDPRSTKKIMTPHSYRRILSNPRYTGRWEYGRYKNKWKSSKNSVRQVRQADAEVVVLQDEKLRIVSDELFQAVQQVLQGKKFGPHGPRKRRDHQLWDFVTDCFVCAKCQKRMYRTGYRSAAMFCSNGVLCPCNVALNRREAVESVCRKLSQLLQDDKELLLATISEAERLNRQGDESLEAELKALTLRRAKAQDWLDTLCESNQEMKGEQRELLKGKLNLATNELALLDRSLTDIRKRIQGAKTPFEPDRVREIINNLGQLLNDGASGRLGEDVVFLAANLFRQLVGGEVQVVASVREARKRKVVEGKFQPHLLTCVASQSKLGELVPASTAPIVTVWLRQPPRVDRLADRVKQLVDDHGLNFQAAEKKLLEEGEVIKAGNIWHAYRRWYEMRGLDVPRARRRRGKGKSSDE